MNRSQPNDIPNRRLHVVACGGVYGINLHGNAVDGVDVAKAAKTPHIHVAQIKRLRQLFAGKTEIHIKQTTAGDII